MFHASLDGQINRCIAAQLLAENLFVSIVTFCSNALPDTLNLKPEFYLSQRSDPHTIDFVFVSMRLLITRLPAFHDNYFNYADAARDIYSKLIEGRSQLKSAVRRLIYIRRVFNCFSVILMASKHSRLTRAHDSQLIRILIRIDLFRPLSLRTSPLEC